MGKRQITGVVFFCGNKKALVRSEGFTTEYTFSVIYIIEKTKGIVLQ
jgi:hypothetical protein